jgi:outer membrane protein assembly factor BamD (BamD/ComL family)
MKTLSLLPLLLAAVPLFAQPDDPAKVLFDLGTRDEQTGRVDRAKLTLLTLASTYQGNPLADKAKVELGAIFLYLEAQSQIRAGQNTTAYGTLRTLLRVYPESPLAKRADDTARSLGIPADPRK